MKKVVIYVFLFVAVVTAVCLVLIVILPYNPNGYIMAQEDKERMLADPSRPPSLVLLGGSTVAFGYNSPAIEEATGMNVINAGLHASLGMKCILEETLPHLREGDVLAFVPEIDQFYDALPYGELEYCDWTVLTHFRKAKDMTWRQWWTVADNLPAHLRRRIDYTVIHAAGKEQPTVYRRDGFNSNGDLTAHWDDPDTKYHWRGSTTHVEAFNEDFYAWYLEQMDALERRGVKVLILPTPLARSEYEASKGAFDYAVKRIGESRYPYAVPFNSYVMPDTMFYDTPYHVRKIGNDTLTARLIRYLQAHPKVVTR